MKPSVCLASLAFCCAANLSGQNIPVVPVFECAERVSYLSGTVHLLEPAGPGSVQIRLSGNVPLYANLTLNPAGSNRETVQSGAGSSANTLVVVLNASHAAGEPVFYEASTYLHHFGYINPTTTTYNVVAGSASNFFSPSNPDRGQPSVFPPGKFDRVISVDDSGRNRDLIWVLGQSFTVGRHTDAAFLCPEPARIPVVGGRSLTLAAGAQHLGVPLATASVPSEPNAALTVTLASRFLATGLAPPSPAGDSQVAVTNLRIVNGVVLGDVTLGPAAPARFAVSLRVAATDGLARFGTAFVQSRTVCALSVGPPSLPPAMATFPYASIAFSASGGAAPYSFSIGSGSLPAGMTLTNGVLSGTPTTAGAYPFSLTVTDDGPCMANASYSLTVQGPACAANVTSQVQISLGGFRRNLATGRFQQTVTLRNNGTGALAGPVAIVFDNLSANASLFNPGGSTACAAPLGRPFLIVPVGADELFTPGETATAALEFTNSQPAAAITYTPRILAGGTQR